MDDPQAIAELDDRKHAREAMRTAAMALRSGWELDRAWLASMPQKAAAMIEGNADDRTKLRAMELLAALRRDNLATLVALDRIDRLDAAAVPDPKRSGVPPLEFESGARRSLEVRFVNAIGDSGPDGTA